MSINNLKGYFNFKDGLVYLRLLFNDEEQKSNYFNIFKKIITNGIIKDIDKIRLNYDELPSGKEFKINTLIIVLKSIIEKNNTLSSNFFKLLLVRSLN